MRADRLLSLVLLLQTRGKMTALALAEELGVSRRTILRDIDALSFAGVPLYADGGHGGGIALDEKYRLSLTGLKESEAHTLFIGSNHKLLEDIGLGDAAESTLLKLLAALPALHQPSVNDMRQRILIDPLSWWHDSQPLPFWDQLQQAVYEDRCIQMRYESYSGESDERLLEPYSLVAKASLWYLIARRDGELRTYRVSRVINIELLDTHFRRAQDFDLSAYWHEHTQKFLEFISNYEFILRIDSHRVNPARWQSPGRAELIEPADKDGWLVVRCWGEALEEARSFTLSFGGAAQVVEPLELREAVLAAAREMLENPVSTLNFL
ncbi:MAG: WYL domain-containing protein [Chloroflexota bacterium]